MSNNGNTSQYNKVSLFVLYWEVEPDPEIAVKSSEKRENLVNVLEAGYGFKVQRCCVPLIEATKAQKLIEEELDRFLSNTSEDTLLAFYYHGHGGFNEHTRMFSIGPSR